MIASRHPFGVSVALALLLCPLCAGVCAQPVGNVTVQLPTFEQFGVSTTVVVPDRGTLSLGGVNSSGLGSRQFAPGVPGLGSRAIGRASSSAGMSIRATIIDHDEIDRALLAEAARRRGDVVDIRGRAVADAPRLPLTTPTHRAAARARDGRNTLAPPRFRTHEESAVQADAGRAELYWQRARRAEAEGQPQQARIFYRRVVKHGSPVRKRMAVAELERLARQLTR
ncbi:MAG: hypothetical protein AAGD11_00980 [Planctomycetota bacterium]